MVPAIGDERREGWVAALNPVLYPPDERRRRPATREPVGCPAFGLDSVVERPARAPSRERSVAPGLHQPEIGGADVVWWDAAVLDLGVAERVGLRQQRLLEADADGAVSERGVVAHDEWQRARAAVRAAGGTPRVRVVAATEWAARDDAQRALPPSAVASGLDATAVRVESCAPAAGPRPHGRRFGTLVHAVLATVDLEAGRSGVESVGALHARLLGAPDDERLAAVAATIRALEHPLLRRAADAARTGDCRRETPVAIRLTSGDLVEGVVDVAFRANGGWTVIDFKTDVELAIREREYRAQAALYAAAIAQATNQPTEAIILRV